MKRSVDLDAWRGSQSGHLHRLAQLAELEAVPRRKPRDPAEYRFLARSALEAIRRREAESRLVRVGERTYELRTVIEARAAKARKC